MNEEILSKAAVASMKQNRPMYVYGVAYRGYIISAIKPPYVAYYKAVAGHIYGVNAGVETHIAKLQEAA